jgi:Na+-translocating ferredoxin:NAD+ oxidoreductase RNF subunit RnfB
MSSSLNRRDLFALLGRPFQRNAEPSPTEALPTDAVAVIQGRRCIALTSFCAVCVERCPTPGAMKLTSGLPSVIPDVCTGCGICHEVCPAPTNAVLMLPRRRAPGRVVASPENV